MLVMPSGLVTVEEDDNFWQCVLAGWSKSVQLQLGGLHRLKEAVFRCLLTSPTRSPSSHLVDDYTQFSRRDPTWPDHQMVHPDTAVGGTCDFWTRNAVKRVP